MKTPISLSLVICLLATVSAQAANEVPKPSAGHQKMLEWCGRATITGQTFTTPLGPAREIKGTWVGSPILDGFAIEGNYIYEGRGPNGETRGREIITYDPENDKYTYTFLTNTGYRETAPFTQAGAVAAWQTSYVRDGRQYHRRGTDTDLPDDTGFVRKEQISIDGQTWLPFHESRFVFAEAAGTSEEQELIRLETETWKAATKGDLDTMDRILADGFIGVYGTNEADPIWTKEFLISQLKSGRFVLSSIEYNDLKVRISGTAAAVSGVTTTKETFAGEDLSGQYRFTSTWTNGPAGWQCTSDRAVALVSAAAKDGAAALEGVWEIQEQKVDGSPQDLEGRRALKTYQDGRWHVVYYDTSTGKVDTTLGGPYTFDGKTLNETIGYINQDEGIAYVGATLTLDIQFREGRFYQSGDFFGMKLEEVWAPATATP